MMDKTEFDALLYEDESVSLDFKREQYPFSKETKDVKSELLKDILAFANSWRRSNAYILIGVEDVKGSKSIAVGIDKHLDDADLQLFVSSKTQRPVEFSYSTFEYDGKQIGVLEIPQQERPIYLKKKFGKLSKNTVYMRRGSATVEAEPDEIIKMKEMGHQPKSLPVLDIEFLNKPGNASDGCNISRKTFPYFITFEFADIPMLEEYSPLGGHQVNHDYYRDMANFQIASTLLRPFRFRVYNGGETAARDVRIELEIDKINPPPYVSDNCPDKPQKVRDSIFEAMHQNWGHKLSVDDLGDRWLIEIGIGKCQAKQEIRIDSKVYIGVGVSGKVTIHARIFADELPNPIEKELTIDFDVSPRELAMDELLKM